MNGPKQSRRKAGAKKLEPIDWREFANDAVLNGNMSTLYHRPVNEDPSAYASSEALREIERRVARPSGPTVGSGPAVGDIPRVGLEPTVGAHCDEAGGTGVAVIEIPTVGPIPTVGLVALPGSQAAAAPLKPTVGMDPTVGVVPTATRSQTAVPTVGLDPTVGARPTVGLYNRRKVKPIRDVQDALTLAGHVLYKAMYGAPDGAKSKTCAKGYRQLAAETHLDKDTVRDLISEFKEKGIVRETRTYDPDTRSAKTYEVLSYKAILQFWREANLQYVTTGRKRPTFCTATGEALSIPTVGLKPTVERRHGDADKFGPTVGMAADTGEVLSALQQITGAPVDQEAADRLIADCRLEAADCTLEEIIEIAWSKAFLCRSGKIDNPIGFLITQVPKHFQGDALESYRQNKRRELDAAAAQASREEARREEGERELAAMEEKNRMRGVVAERHRVGQGIDLKALLQDPDVDETLRQWAQRLVKLGHRYPAEYA